MTRTIGLLLLLGCCSTTVVAQKPADPMEVCAQLGDANARLACFDHEIQRRHAAAATGEAPQAAPAAGAPPTVKAAPAAAPAVVNHNAADDTIGLTGKELSQRRKVEGIAPHPAPTLIVAGLTQLQQRPGHQYYFELDNGQMWESVDNQGQLLLGAHETVSIRSGVLGAFFLKTQEGKSIRVHRLR